MKLTLGLGIVVAVLFSGSAFANERFANNGQVFLYTENTDGLVLTSKYPVAIYYEAGAASRWEVVTDTIYLGRSCDAFSRDWGAGTWSWSNAGFGFKLPGKTVWFTRQDFPGEIGSECRE